MTQTRTATKAWQEALRPACRSRRMRFVSETGFVVDDVYLTEFVAQVTHPDRDPERVRINWTVEIKPLAVDEILWAAFLPDVTMGPQMRINRRVNGAFQVQSLQIGDGSREVAASADPDWHPLLDEFDRVRAAFIDAHPTVADFVAVLEQGGDARAVERQRLRMITSLIAADRAEDAARLTDDAIARGEHGPMGSTVDVYEYLSAYAKGPAAFDVFLASLRPTHYLNVLAESDRRRSLDLSRPHHRGRLGRHLSIMDGSDPWAVVLTALPASGAPDDHSTSLYLQAAGSAEAMTVEFCKPGGAELGAVSVRSVVGRPHIDGATLDVEIPLPHGTETITRHEVFAADEATELFEAFYRTDALLDGYVLRPVEGYAADGEPIDLR